MTVNVRPMVKRDKPTIVRFLKATPQFTPEEVVVAEELIDSYLDDPTGSGYHIMAAERDTQVSGYVCFGPTSLTDGTWDLYWIAVSPDNQGRGIGRALMAAAEKHMTESSARQVLVETSSQPLYEKTRRFYHSLGYELIARIPDFYKVDDDLIIFLKRLK